MFTKEDIFTHWTMYPWVIVQQLDMKTPNIGPKDTFRVTNQHYMTCAPYVTIGVKSQL